MIKPPQYKSVIIIIIILLGLCFTILCKNKMKLLFCFGMVYAKNHIATQENKYIRGRHSVLSSSTHTSLLFCLKIMSELIEMIWRNWIYYLRKYFSNHDFQIDIKFL
jgi:small-conductance mechanosensitive channel